MLWSNACDAWKDCRHRRDGESSRSSSSSVTADAVEDFAEMFGELSRRDGGIGAWLVKPRKEAGTYSEIKGPAGFHTDSQYHHQPERLFVLA